MGRSARLVATVTTAVILQIVSAPAGALNLFSFVGTGGSNSNACTSAAAPCASFTGALAKTEPSGQIRCVGSLGSASNFVIDKPITIDCTGVPSLTAGLNGEIGITINMDEATFPNGEVTLRGLFIDGLPELSGNTPGSDGIRVIGGGGAVHIENSKIMGFAQQGIDFAPSSNVDLFIRDTIISGNAGGGVSISPAAAALVRASLGNVRLDGNGSFGLLVAKLTGGVAGATLDGVEAARGTGVGIQANGASAAVFLGNTVVTGNLIGLRVLNGGRIFSYGTNSIHLNNTNGAPTNTATLK